MDVLCDFIIFIPKISKLFFKHFLKFPHILPLVDSRSGNSTSGSEKKHWVPDAPWCWQAGLQVLHRSRLACSLRGTKTRCSLEEPGDGVWTNPDPYAFGHQGGGTGMMQDPATIKKHRSFFRISFEFCRFLWHPECQILLIFL